MDETRSEWRTIDGSATAWFAVPSLVAGAAFAGRVLELSDEAAIDLRANGVRVRLRQDVHADAISVTALDQGLTADLSVLQQLDVVLGSPAPSALQPFWQRTLDYRVADDGLADPLSRDPRMRFRRSDEPRPLRNRVHLDVVRPPAVLEQVGLGPGSGPYGLCHADPDGNEVDLVPGDPFDDGAATSDWQAVFSAMACYRTTSSAQQRQLATVVAAIADAAGFPLLVDLRPGLVIIDSGKDRWDADAHGLALDFTDLAAEIQTAARATGATADLALPRFVQVFLDAADLVPVRAFWVAALGYLEDRRDGVRDLVDPLRLNPVLGFQQLDPADIARRQQRNRLHLELTVPHDLAPARVERALAGGGQLVEETVGRWRLADPESNELVITSGS